MPPSITSTSGTISHGQSVSIAGSGFGTKGGSDPNKPLIWADFETDINPTNLGTTTAWNGNQNFVRQGGVPQYGLSTNNVVGTWSPGINSFRFQFNHSFSSKLYLSGKRYFDFAATANQKFFRIFPVPQPGSFTASTSNSGICYDDHCTTQAGRFQGVTFDQNAWMMHEFLWRKATIDNCAASNTGDGYYEFIKSGVRAQILDGTMSNDLTQDYGGSGSIGLGVFENFTDSANLPPDNSKVYQDDLYVDDTWARVIIGNASTLATSTQREIQIPSAWVDGSITVTINRGAFGASDSAWLYVIDSSNVASSSFAITFGSAPPPPAPVVNLRRMCLVDTRDQIDLVL